MAQRLNQPTRKNERLESLLSFSKSLERQIPVSVGSKSCQSLLQDVEKQISAFPSKFAQSTKWEEWDRCGTSIWNICTRLRRDLEPDKQQDMRMILVLARTFAFLLLDCAHQCGKSSSGNLPRLMKTGLKAGKDCIGHKQFEITKKILTKVGGYEDLVHRSKMELTLDDKDACEKLIAEYFVLRTALAWHTNQFDMAEHMFQKSISSQQVFDPNTAESLADVFYEMGKSLLSEKQYQIAVKWFERAFDVINSLELDKLSTDAGELRTSVIQSLIKALLGLKDKESVNKARNWLEMLENTIGDKLVVLLLRLEMIAVPNLGEEFDSIAYSDVLEKIVRTLHLNERNFKLIMFHIRILNDKNPMLACGILEILLATRVLEDGRDEYIEKIIITRLYMMRFRGSEDKIQQLGAILTNFMMKTSKKISAGASLAAHMLLWKRIESCYSQGQYDMAECWCKLATHPIFEESGESNMAKISRKLLLCVLAKKDVGNTREVFASISEAAKNEPMTRFLMYKIAIRSQETAMATECLKVISSGTMKDPTLLYACCLDARQMNNKEQLLASLELVLERHGNGSHSEIHLPSLLRLTIGLIVEALDNAAKTGVMVDDDAVNKLCTMFENGALSVRKARGSAKPTDELWTVDEINWFSKNSYNLAVKHLADWHPRQNLKMLKCCIEFIDQNPSNVSEQMSVDLSLRKMFCEFSAATALVALARAEDDIEIQLQDYLQLRKHVDSFDTLIQDQLEKMGEEAQEDLKRKLSILAAFDFEAACALKAWDSLGEVIIKAIICKSSWVYEIMADCILSADAPTLVLVTTLKKIINAAWNLETVDMPKLAKYMRCLFQVAISENREVAEQLLDQVQSHAKEASETGQPYPSEELEWIAARAFNHAVDLYCSIDDEGCKNWSGKALNIAHYCLDGGALKRTLQSKLLELKFED